MSKDENVQNENREYLKAYAFLEDDFVMANSKKTMEYQERNSRSRWHEAFRLLFKSRSVIFALLVIVFIILMAVVGPAISGYSDQEQKIENQNLSPRIPLLEKLGIFDGTQTEVQRGKTIKTNAYQSSQLKNTYYWFGSDELGRDIFTRTCVGTGISLYVALVAVFVDLCFGMSYGMISGYFGGKVDFIMQRFCEILNGIPTLVIVTLLMLVLKPGLGTITLALAMTSWVGMSKIARAQVLKLKEQEFVLAAKTLGARSFTIIFKEILPNIFGQLLTVTMLSIPNAIFIEAFLAFVGLGVPPPMASLGTLISNSFKMFTTYPYMMVPPLLVLGLLMFSFNLLADGLRDRFDPAGMGR